MNTSDITGAPRYSAMCSVCSGAGTVQRGWVFLRLRPCRHCRGTRYATAAGAR
ncbi:hypothetical protein [Yinghuangia soli]|uniref:Uncharacterized protein n=1 Tax=Yinghuangia soli TaxID=2908204 RepID=A0AA41Q6M1_9ACTN|nr:hypothetical protein [Yinghuangia soli]MCF2531324.1 hypothetical protein [Yinghuangia soli]